VSTVFGNQQLLESSGVKSVVYKWLICKHQRPARQMIEIETLGHFQALLGRWLEVIK
jgi:hypothetical protein